MRAKNADCTCTHSTKNKTQRGWSFYSSFGFLSFCFVLAFFTVAIVKLTSGVTSRFILLHPVSSRTSKHSVYSTFFAYRLSQYLTRFLPKTLLWIVQRHEFALHIDLVTFTLLPGWIILVNLGARWQKSQVITTMFDLVNYSSSSECGLLVSSSLIWNTANWIFDGSNHYSLR